MTGRHAELADVVQDVLVRHRTVPATIVMKPINSENNTLYYKLDAIQAEASKLPNLKKIIMWEDRFEHAERFSRTKVRGTNNERLEIQVNYVRPHGEHIVMNGSERRGRSSARGRGGPSHRGDYQRGGDHRPRSEQHHRGAHQPRGEYVPRGRGRGHHTHFDAPQKTYTHETYRQESKEESQKSFTPLGAQPSRGGGQSKGKQKQRGKGRA